MVRQFGAAGNRDVQKEELIDTLNQYLQSKRYLIVFDDVWHKEFWQVMRRVLPDNGKGSRIIITMRRDTVAAFCKENSFDHVHLVEPLTETMSWDLFCQRAFHYEHEAHCPPELEQLSHEFLRMCRGLPLAIEAVAGVLSTKEKTRSEWQRIYDNFEFEIESNPHLEDISRLLVLSFRDLPYQLKMCFLYFSIFPESYLIPNDKLYKLWIAEDFVQTKGLKISEEVAEEYLRELVQRNLVQACEGFYGLERFCRLQESMCELVRQEADEIGFCHIRDVSIPHFTVRRTSPPQYCIRVCWQVAYLQHRPHYIRQVTTKGLCCRRSCTYLSRYVLRSAASPLGTAAGFLLLVEGQGLLAQQAPPLGDVVWPYWLAIPLENKGRLLSIKSNEDLMRKSRVIKIRVITIGALENSLVVTVFRKYKLLTLLDVENVPLSRLPEEVGNLFHLKYLSLKNTKVKRLPKSVGKLQNLQTLDVRNTLLVALPMEINKLKNLQHLLASRSDSVVALNSSQGVRIKEGFGYLENLQTLMTVEASLIRLGLEEELAKLTGLRRLGISRLTAVALSALGPSIGKMNDLEYLSIHTVTNDEIFDLQTISSPPLFLQRLVLRGRLQRFPNWISSLQILSVLCLSMSRLTDDPLRHIYALPNLVSLWLYRAYEGEQLHFVVGGFQKLKLLVLRDLQRLEALEIQEGALPLLEELRIGPSPLLNDVPSGIQHLRSLKVLAFYDMPNEFVRSMQPEGGSEYVKVAHVPSVQFWYRVQGRKYASYELGESNFWDRLQGLVRNNINDVGQNDLRLSFCYSDDEANSASASTSRAPWDHDRMSFSSDQFSFFSDDIED
ncbi:hypothetical protein TIFTF001_032516 [Ficus carica]|uniref:NB-ARC domain-containing protein n=1 Tax=Ficus carica TaxID=3494 RepID=A0AA88J2I4_FICCA|nr:hypothetical protein TIFTF001_032516 [Ficus carica]